MKYKFGPNKEEVDEVLDFIESNRLLSGGQIPNDVEAVIIRDLDQIPAEEDYEKYNDERPNWRDILGIESAEYYGRESAMWGNDFPYERNILDDIVMNLTAKYKTTMCKRYINHYFDQNIPGILSSIIHCRIVMGKSHVFFEKLFKIFVSGGYPCGWSGKYPEGKIIVYYPPK